METQRGSRVQMMKRIETALIIFLIGAMLIMLLIAYTSPGLFEIKYGTDMPTNASDSLVGNNLRKETRDGEEKSRSNVNTFESSYIKVDAEMKKADGRGNRSVSASHSSDEARVEGQSKAVELRDKVQRGGTYAKHDTRKANSKIQNVTEIPKKSDVNVVLDKKMSVKDLMNYARKKTEKKTRRNETDSEYVLKKDVVSGPMVAKSGVPYKPSLRMNKNSEVLDQPSPVNALKKKKSYVRDNRNVMAGKKHDVVDKPGHVMNKEADVIDVMGKKPDVRDKPSPALDIKSVVDKLESVADKKPGDVSKPSTVADKEPGDVSKPSTVADKEPGDVPKPSTMADKKPGDVSIPSTIADKEPGDVSNPRLAAGQASDDITNLNPMAVKKPDVLAKSGLEDQKSSDVDIKPS